MAPKIYFYTKFTLVLVSFLCMIHTDMLLIIRTTKFISLGQLKTFRIYEHHTTNSTKHDVLDDIQTTLAICCQNTNSDRINLFTNKQKRRTSENQTKKIPTTFVFAQHHRYEDG